jgi:hypothetical protein
MPGVGYGEFAIGIDAQDEAGGKSAVAAADHALIHGGENFTGALGVVGERAHGADQERNGHGRGQALAADVAKHDEG